MIIMRYDEETNTTTQVLDTTKIVTCDHDGIGEDGSDHYTCYTEEGEFYFIFTREERNVIVNADEADEE